MQNQNATTYQQRLVKENEAIREALYSIKSNIVNNELQSNEYLKRSEELLEANISLQKQYNLLEKKYDKNHIDSAKAQEIIRSPSRPRQSPYTIGNHLAVGLVVDLENAVKKAKVIARSSSCKR
jgi:hypothetical protein